jgi:hypothetical protein
MIVVPIENIISKIKEMTKNPITVLYDTEREQILNILDSEKNSKQKCCKSQKMKEPFETELLEKNISKIGSLLALGFGEAGSKIIASNLQNNSNGEINPMIPGKKVIAIYGFCDIRNFTDSTEVLQEEVMIFVNEIAQIVHEITHENCGSANKNVGDAFLLIWKFDEFLLENENNNNDNDNNNFKVNFNENSNIICTNNLRLINDQRSNQLADCAFISIIKILAKIQKDYTLDKVIIILRLKIILIVIITIIIKILNIKNKI